VRVHAHAGEWPARPKYRTDSDFNHAYKKIKKDYSFLSCMVMVE
jgi:hypothetical protein